MGFNTVGSQTLSFPLATRWESPGVAATPGQTYYWIVRANPLALQLSNVYALVIPVVRGPGAVAELPLLAKFFAKGLPMAIPVPTPATGDFNAANVSLLFLLKRSGRVSSPIPALTIDVFVSDTSVPNASGGVY